MQDPPTSAEVRGTSQMGPKGQIPKLEHREQESGRNSGQTNRGESSTARKKRRKEEKRALSQMRGNRTENVVGRPVFDRKAAKDQAGKAVCVNYSLGE